MSKIGEEQLFYLMSRGLSEAEASAMIVSGFVEPITKELPLEYAVEMNRLIQLQMEARLAKDGGNQVSPWTPFFTWSNRRGVPGLPPGKARLRPRRWSGLATALDWKAQ